MPWTVQHQPSLGLGILSAVLEQQEIPCTVEHVSLEMLSQLKLSTYNLLSQAWALNDFLFSYVCDRTIDHRQLVSLRERAAELWNLSEDLREYTGTPDGLVEQLLFLRESTIPSLLKKIAKRVNEQNYSLVGFTCMFDQTIASIAQAKLIKKLNPNTMIALGGYAVREPTASAILKSFEWIDVVCTDEGEATISALAKSSVGQMKLSDVPGILYRNNNTIEKGEKSSSWDMNKIPTPNFDDYFNDIDKLKQNHNISLESRSISCENSRGCWWGQKKHCVFCGIKKADLTYRFKSSEKVIAEIDYLSKKYKTNEIRFSDYILPNSYYKDLLPIISNMNDNFKLSGEIKANVTEDKVRLLSQAGFTEVQPGIESFSNDILKYMDKGVKSTHCIYLLKLGKKYGVKILYNILFGFPNEKSESYLEMVGQIENLHHLDAPSSCIPVQITRYAPMHVDPIRFGLSNHRPHENYEIIFSDQFLKDSGFELADFCYYFERNFSHSSKVSNLHLSLRSKVGTWISDSSEKLPKLEFCSDNKIIDERGENNVVIELSDQQYKLLKALEKPSKKEKCKQQFIFIDQINSFDKLYTELQDMGLIFTDKDDVIALV